MKCNEWNVVFFQWYCRMKCVFLRCFFFLDFMRQTSCMRLLLSTVFETSEPGNDFIIHDEREIFKFQDPSLKCLYLANRRVYWNLASWPLVVCESLLNTCLSHCCENCFHLFINKNVQLTSQVQSQTAHKCPMAGYGHYRQQPPTSVSSLHRFLWWGEFDQLNDIFDMLQNGFLPNSVWLKSHLADINGKFRLSGSKWDKWTSQWCETL